MKKLFLIVLVLGLILCGFYLGYKIKEKQKTIEVDNDTQVLNYFEDKKNEIEEEIESGELSEKTKEKIVEITDFVFYDTEINGVKYSDLKEDTKEKIRGIIGKVDEKVENKVPNYKEKIKETFDENYPIVVEKVKEGITIIDNTLEDEIGADKYNELKDKAREVKDKVVEKGQELKENAKEGISTAKEKVKNWYEGWR